MAILRISGESRPTATDIKKTGPYIEKEFLLKSDRAASEPIDIAVEPDDVYEINTEDGVVWLVSGTELLSNYSKKYTNSRGGASIEIYEFKNNIITTNTRGIGNILSFKKLIKWAFGKTPIVETFLPPLIKKIETSLVPEEGLYKWIYKENFGKKTTTLTSSDPILLFIHGTVTNAQGTYGDLFSGLDDQDWKELTVNFKSNIYAFQHHTLAKSPLQNTLDLIKILQDGIEINLVTSSRGGLIGEILTMASVYSNAPIYLDGLAETLRENKRTNDLAILSQLIDEAKHKKITITNYHRVACPAFGTTLVAGRLDIYLKVILNLIGLIPVLKASIVYDLVKELLINVVNSKSDTSILPGVEAMMPTSPFIKGLNVRTEELDAKLRIFAGDIDPKGFLKTLEVFLVDVFYRSDHDFIVNSKSMFGGIKRSDTQYIFHKGNNVSHFNYYVNEQTRDVLYTSLKNSTTEDMFPLPKDMEIDHDYLSHNSGWHFTRGLYANHLKMIGDNTLIYSPQINEKIDEEDKIKIFLKHGDLGYARFPLLVGHFKGDGIVAAEKEVDGHMNYHLSQAHKAGVYPGAIETSEVFFNSDSSFKGTVVVGLGYPGQLSGESLTKAIQHGALNLALKSKYLSNSIKPIGISSLLVGSDYAGISIRNTIRCLIDGISNANQHIRNLKDPDIPAITTLEIIELFEDRAITVAKFINNFVLDEYSDFVQKKHFVFLQKVGGAQKRFESDYTSEWWYHLQITAELDANNSIDALNYLLINNGAKAEAMRVPVQGVYLTKLIESCISNNNTNSTFSKLFFNSLIPNSIKEFANDKRNFILILDGITASIPWEMLFNQTKDSDLPIAVKSGMIRQLRVDSPYVPISDITTNNVLVIANPHINNEEYPPLPGAEIEGEEVGKLFNDPRSGFNCPAPLIERPFMDIMMGLNDLSYRIIHLAGHGNYDPLDPVKSGMVLSDGFFLNPAELSKLSYIPELVFINCCHLGKTDKAIIKWNELAANLGTEFITLGVKCVVAAGWAVDDAAASTFAERFYRYMLDGGEFGEAIQHARKSIYEEHGNNNTWGAYQCYGDPFYKFNLSGKNEKKTKESFISISELLVELENLFQKIEPQSTRSTFPKEEIDKIEKVVNDGWGIVPEAIELIANCYYELGDYDKAIEKYEALFNNQSGSYKIESILRLSRLTMNKGVKLILAGDKNEGQILVTFSKKITDNLLALSSTSDKHIMKGGNLKREALIYDAKNKTERINKLQEARNEYRTAFEQILQIHGRHDGYPLQNWIVLDEILRAYKIPSTTTSKQLLEFVNKSMKELAKSTQTNTFFYNSYLAELMFCKLMIGKKSPKQINELETVIYKKYKEGWEIDGSSTKANIILKQFEIVITLLKIDQSVGSLLASIEKLNLKLEKLFNLK